MTYNLSIQELILFTKSFWDKKHEERLGSFNDLLIIDILYLKKDLHKALINLHIKNVN